ncbi:DUF1768 domain-containing protein [Streptomyces sp. NPDC089799]|uniref:DUF7639 domain-containing protein n=1 Tax=Streptomyces sp. NPDC089799 TaxID=3155066 RepID=UPI00341E26BB
MEDLFAFADGALRCDGLTDVSGLKRLMLSGRISPTDPAHRNLPPEPSRWRSRRPAPVTPDGFILEVTDRIDALNSRPTSTDRCWDAIHRYRDEPTEPNRLALRAAYLKVPPHLRIHVLGDIDRQDRPLRILTTDTGQAVDGDGPVVTAFMHQQTLDYFIRAEDARPTPAPHTVALPDLDITDLLTAAQDHSPGTRLSVLAGLLRTKISQHPDLAEALLSTGDAPLHYAHPASPYWKARLPHLLELIRSELSLSAAD